MNRLLAVLLTAAGVAVSLPAAEQPSQTETNLLSDDALIAAVFKTAKRPAEPTQKKLLPAPKFAHSASTRLAGAKNQQEVSARAAAINVPVTAASAPPLPVRPPKYKLVLMSTDELAERRAVIGWKIRMGKNR